MGRRDTGLKAPPVPSNAEGVELNETSDALVLKVKSKSVRTVPEAIAKGEVDLRIWTVERSRVNSWEVATKDPSTGKVTVTPLWQVGVWFKRRDESTIDFDRISELTLQQWRDAAPRTLIHSPPLPASASGRILELDLFDPHMGKLSWAQETGINYDTDIMCSDYLKAMRKLVSIASKFPVERILLPTGNDFMHVDNLEQSTTSGRVRLDVDSRATRIFERAKLLLIAAIEELLEVAPRVYVPIIPGNHDRQAMIYMGHVLSARFWHMTDKVVVDFAPLMRKYVRHGRVLLGYTHGGEEKRDRLPLLMAHEAKADWAATDVHVWRTGHFHTRSTSRYLVGDTIDGVWVEQCEALCAADEWHTRKGFCTGPRGASATIWDAREGRVADFRVTL